MKIKLFSIFLFITLNVRAQIDTLEKAKAYTNSFLVFHSSNDYGSCSNGHYWVFGMNNRYDSKEPIEFVRVDMQAGTVIYKRVSSTIATTPTSVVWRQIFDSSENYYVVLNYGNRKIIKFNLRDSIQYEDLGNCFVDGSSLCYSIRLGNDKHIYGGGSSGETGFFDYDPARDTIHKWSKIDNQSYVLDIAGTKDWIYLVTGQSRTNQLYAVRKRDGKRFKLFTISSAYRFDLGGHTDGVYFQCGVDTLKGTWRINGTDTIRFHKGDAMGNTCIYTPTGIPQPGPLQRDIVWSDFNQATSTLNYSYDQGNSVHSILINSSKVSDPVGAVFFDRTDTNSIYYTGRLYGNTYKYDYRTDSAMVLGNTGFNIYSVLQYDDSIFYFGGYPNGSLQKWNKNKSWTAQTFDTHGRLLVAQNDANPRLCTFFRTNTNAQFHHTNKLVRVGNYIVAAGDVIRTFNSASVGAYDPLQSSAMGYDANKINSLAFRDLVAWKDQAIFSTDSSNGGHPKLYFYKPSANQMVDSIDYNYKGYGSLYVMGDELIGIASARVYKINLRTKKLTESVLLNGKVTYSQMLDNGVIMINTNATNIPKDFWDIVYVNYTNAAVFNHYIYSVINGKIVRTKITD